MSFFCHHVRTVTLVTMQPISDDMLTMSTRMHSSRMHTAHLLPISPSMHCSRGVYLPRGWCTCPGGVPAQEEVYMAEGVSVQGGVPALVVYLPRGVYLPWGCTWLGGVPAQVLPLWTEFLTQATEKITLLQTSFVASKSLCRCHQVRMGPQCSIILAWKSNHFYRPQMKFGAR